MKNLTIYNVYIEMTSQDQCDRMLQLCIEKKMPYWKTEDGYSFSLEGEENWFEYSKKFGEFFISSGNDTGIAYGKTKVTEQKFIELLKLHNQ